MGTLTFQLPAELPQDAVRELERACLAGGPDNMPSPTEMRQNGNLLVMSRPLDESGYLVAPWAVDVMGVLASTSATLMERPTPYNLLIELARGKLNQLRSQASDWKVGGLVLPPLLESLIQEASRTFGQAITRAPSAESTRLAQAALTLSYQAANQLVQVYTEQVFTIRHQRHPRLDTSFACRLERGDSSAAHADFARAFNSVCLPLSWNTIEAEEASYHWGPWDALLTAALAQGLSVTAGPLIDFSSARLPDWLWLWERDLTSLATFMCKFVEAAVRRYRDRIRRWQLTAASNSARVLSLTEEELLGLTYRLGETARQIDPTLELVIGVAQPWGEYMTEENRTHSPFVFADTLIRSGLNVSALDIEIIMGLTPRGSYCRDLLEVSRILDLYALLGVPLRVTLGYPSSEGSDDDADPEIRVAGGCWRSGFTPEVQADWATWFPALALCKPYVQGVQWCHWSDAAPHQFPHCGLLDPQGQPKPALTSLRTLREKHVK
jgi:GH35 family endo-1,4-beta-xylanase